MHLDLRCGEVLALVGENGAGKSTLMKLLAGIGEQVVATALKAIKGEAQPKVVDTGFYWYDKQNIADPKIAAVLYE